MNNYLNKDDDLNGKDVSEGKIGVIGFGSIGQAVIENLADKNYNLVVYNRTYYKLKEIVRLSNVTATKDLNQVFCECTQILICLSDDKAVKSVLYNKDITHWDGKYIADLSSISQQTAKELYTYSRVRGASYFDSPISGGVEGAREGTLSIMVGGNKNKYNKIFPLLQELGSNLVFVGEPGLGAVTKQINQIIVASYLVGISEAFALADCMGLDIQKIFESIKGGYAQSRVLEAKFPNIVNDDYSPGGRVSLHKKDLKNVLEFAETNNLRPEMTLRYFELFIKAEEAGMGNLDHSVLYKLFKQKFREINK